MNGDEDGGNWEGFARLGDEDEGNWEGFAGLGDEDEGHWVLRMGNDVLAFWREKFVPLGSRRLAKECICVCVCGGGRIIA